MRLRNKETGLTGKLTYMDYNIDESEREIDLTIMLDNSGGECIDRQFYSLDELKKFLRDWEECKPVEPLIKDEKIRKAVRAWAEVNKIEDNEKVEYKGIYWKLYYSTVGSATIQFNVPLRVADGSYTITELCGEEEK